MIKNNNKFGDSSASNLFNGTLSTAAQLNPSFPSITLFFLSPHLVFPQVSGPTERQKKEEARVATLSEKQFVSAKTEKQTRETHLEDKVGERWSEVGRSLSELVPLARTSGVRVTSRQDVPEWTASSRAGPHLGQVRASSTSITRTLRTSRCSF